MLIESLAQQIRGSGFAHFGYGLGQVFFRPIDVFQLVYKKLTEQRTLLAFFQVFEVDAVVGSKTAVGTFRAAGGGIHG